MKRIEAMLDQVSDKQMKAGLRMILQTPSLETRVETARKLLELADEAQRSILVAFIAETRQRWMEGMQIMQENATNIQTIRDLYDALSDPIQRRALEGILIEVSLEKSLEQATQALKYFHASQEEIVHVLERYITQTRQRWMDGMHAMGRHRL